VLLTDQDGSEHRRADAFGDFILSFFIGPCEIVFPSRSKHSARNHKAGHISVLFNVHTIKKLKEKKNVGEIASYNHTGKIKLDTD
jgi:hypothetical protein